MEWIHVGALRGHNVSVWCLAWHPIKPLLASSDRSGHVRIWSMVNAKDEIAPHCLCHTTLTVTARSADAGLGLAWSPCGQYLIIVNGHSVHLWMNRAFSGAAVDTASFRSVHTLSVVGPYNSTFGQPVHGIASSFSPTGVRRAVRRIMRPPSSATPHSASSGRSSLSSVSSISSQNTAPANGLLDADDRDETGEGWDREDDLDEDLGPVGMATFEDAPPGIIAQLRYPASVPIHSNARNCLVGAAVHVDGRVMAIWKHNWVAIWPLDSGGNVYSVRGPFFTLAGITAHSACSVAWSPDGQFLAVTSLHRHTNGLTGVDLMILPMRDLIAHGLAWMTHDIWSEDPFNPFTANDLENDLPPQPHPTACLPTKVATGAPPCWKLGVVDVAGWARVIRLHPTHPAKPISVSWSPSGSHVLVAQRRFAVQGRGNPPINYPSGSRPPTPRRHSLINRAASPAPHPPQLGRTTSIPGPGLGSPTVVAPTPGHPPLLSGYASTPLSSPTHPRAIRRTVSGPSNVPPVSPIRPTPIAPPPPVASRAPSGHFTSPASPRTAHSSRGSMDGRNPPRPHSVGRGAAVRGGLGAAGAPTTSGPAIVPNAPSGRQAPQVGSLRSRAPGLSVDVPLGGAVGLGPGTGSARQQDTGTPVMHGASSRQSPEEMLAVAASIAARGGGAVISTVVDVEAELVRHAYVDPNFGTNAAAWAGGRNPSRAASGWILASDNGELCCFIPPAH